MKLSTLFIKQEFGIADLVNLHPALLQFCLAKHGKNNMRIARPIHQRVSLLDVLAFLEPAVGVIARDLEAF